MGLPAVGIQGTVQVSDAPFRAGFTSVLQSDFHTHLLY